MSDIRKWLQELGLGQYADAFEEDDIALDVAAQLTDADLKEMGVTLGNRKRLLTAIEALSATEAATQDGIAAPPRDAERRQITVMFCDLVGSTALSEKLDPEELREVMAAYQKTAGAVIKRYEGHVAQYLGDGLMTYFGWPAAHEDDAERAVRAGLEIVEAVKAVTAPAPLAVRIGIASGPVVVGETGGGDASVPSAAVGETPNLAARMQSLAATDQVVIAPTTQRLIGGTFETEDMGAHALKGLQAPVHARRVTGLAATEGRFEARGGRLTPFVGRDAEIAMMLERWEQACAGEGQVVLLCGEPGIGKSRVTQVLRERLADEPHTRLRYQCSPYHTNSALHPVIEQVERAAGFARDDTEEIKLDKLEALLKESPLPTGEGLGEGAAPAPLPTSPRKREEGLERSCALFAALLSLPVDRYPPLAMSPEKQKDETLQSLAGRVTARAAARPVLMIFEDAHWIDPTSQELLDLLVPAVAAEPVLLVITHRPEYAPPWSGQGHVVPLTLTRLGRAQAAAMVARVSGGEALAEDVLERIVARTDGVPLFVEELTKTVLESGATSDAAIPSTLQDSLMARLDRLAPVKEVAQIGACIGREFSHQLLAAVSPLGDDALADALRELVESGLVFRAGATYAFKHALVQDAAYNSLLKSRRRQFHDRIANALTMRLPDIGAAQPELLAHHAMEAGRVELAVESWYAAACRARDRFELAEAIASLETGLAALAQGDAISGHDRWVFRYHATIAPLYIAVLGQATPKSNECYEAALALIDQSESDAEAALVRCGTVHSRIWRSRFQDAEDLADNLLAEHGDSADRIACIAAYQGAATIYMWRVRNEAAISACDRVVSLYDRETDRHLSTAMGIDPLVMSLGWKSYSLYLAGFVDQACSCVEACIDWAEELAHPYSLYWALAVPGADLNYFMRNPSAVRKQAQRALALSQKFGFDDSQARIHLGWAKTAMGDVANGLQEACQGIEAFWESGAQKVIAPRYAAEVAELYGMAGKPEEGLQLMRNAPDRRARGGKPHRFSGIYRIEGELLWAIPDSDMAEVERFLREAVAIADEDDAIVHGLRSATSLARFLASQGRSAEARDLVAARYARFTEGFDSADLKEAKALLDELQ